MEFICTLFSCLFFILNSSESSLQSERSTSEGHSSASFQPVAESTARTRSRSPPLRQIFPGVLGFKFDDLALIRLSPYINPNRTFELRRYVFPPDKPIRLRQDKRNLKPIPTGEQIVLSTPNGDVYAILDKRPSKRQTVFRAICIPTSGQPKRAKINMDSGAVEELTVAELEDSPISTHELIAKSYAISRLSSPPSSPTSSSSSQRPSESLVRDMSQSPTIRETFSKVLGFKFEDLEYIRLEPLDYPNRIFELRTYVFPQGKPIGLRTKNRIINPMPSGHQIVLSTNSGDVYAILLKTPNSCTILRPMYTSILGILERVKMNMNSGSVRVLTIVEIAECPVTSRESITNYYKVFRV